MLATLAPRLGLGLAAAAPALPRAALATTLARWLSNSSGNELQVQGSAARLLPPPPLAAARRRSRAGVPTVPATLSMQVVLEPLDGENEGIFFLTLSRPEARNSIGRQFLRVGAEGRTSA